MDDKAVESRRMNLASGQKSRKYVKDLRASGHSVLVSKIMSGIEDIYDMMNSGVVIAGRRMKTRCQGLYIPLDMVYEIPTRAEGNGRGNPTSHRIRMQADSKLEVKLV